MMQSLLLDYYERMNIREKAFCQININVLSRDDINQTVNDFLSDQYFNVDTQMFDR